MNQQIIDAHRPRAIVAPGLQHASICRELFDLRHEETITATNGHRLVERYTDGTRAWLFTKHWSGAFGFSKDQREIVREQIRRWSKPLEEIRPTA